MLPNMNVMVACVTTIFSTMFEPCFMSLPYRKTYFTPLKIDNHPCRAEILKVSFISFHIFYV